MSEFIEVKSSLIPMQSQAILKGVLSKIVQPSVRANPTASVNRVTKQLSFSSSQILLKKKIDKRYVQQVKKADQLQHVVITKEYKTMKKKLDKYARSKSSKVSALMNTKKFTSYFQQDQEPKPQLRRLSNKTSFNARLNIDMLSVIKKEERLAKLRYSIGNIYSSKDSNDRTVFVDRKYNREFAIKKSSLIEAEEILQNKENYKEFLATYKRKQPLIQQAHANRKKFPSEYIKEPLENSGLIIERTKSHMRKSYRGKRVNLSSHQILIRDNDTSSFMNTGEFFNKKMPSIQGEQLMVSACQERQKDEEKENLKTNEGRKPGLTRKKFTLTHKQAMNFFSLRKNYPSPINHINK